MDGLDDDTAVLSTLKSFKKFISRPERLQSAGEPPFGSSGLQKIYSQRLEMEEAAGRVQSHTSLLQMSREKQQMEMSHKRARIELEKVAQLSSRDLQREVDRNQDLQTRIRKMEEREAESGRNLSEQVESNRLLRLKVEELQKRVDEKEGSVAEASLVVSSLKDEVRALKQDLQTQESRLSAQALEKEGLQEQLDLQRKKCQELGQRLQGAQTNQSTGVESQMKIKELERRLALQEQDSVIVRNMKSEVMRVPELEREVKRLRDENVYLRDTRENSTLLKEEVEGLRKKVERLERTREELLNVELQKEKLVQKLQEWENLGQTTGLNIRKPEDLSREVLEFQQKEIDLKQQSYTLKSSVCSLEKSRSQLRAELLEFRSKGLEEQKRRESQEALVRRLQKRVLLLTKVTRTLREEVLAHGLLVLCRTTCVCVCVCVCVCAQERDGMRAILESYDSELSSSEYSPQLTRRLKEAEEVLQKVQNHNADLEAQVSKAQEEAGSFKLQAQTAEMELEELKKQQASVAEGNLSSTAEEVRTLRLKVEELESERQRLEEQKNVLEMRLERHNLQGDYDPVKTKVLHFRINPTSVAKQQRVEEVEQLREECQRLRDRLRAGTVATDDTALDIPPPPEVLDLRKQIESAELRNQRLKEVFQMKIQEFRTVCYVLTGYQVDITTENQYRLTSVYAEHMEDSLLFKASGALGSGSMQLLETEFSRSLKEMVELHLFHQNSIPAFLSAVTLDLFSRVTTV
ncbi:mitotic spindle assembly checkpoint protein MAD1 isoform X2 [Denticeps clupeoides]|uniref:mitotic spindle assembly checkpoint protein MAD1 isoform X2 n=1 Tax=Denticeps clupeoides TaxID=299321 RepID=UPI0010A45D9F|nr:mitotic spindle assembly checkpoint protein MAD1 isoform X2 [Denticeps clupeoides]